MKSMLRLDTPFMKFIGRIGELIVLNLLWLACCLPVVTIGASTSAMHAVAQQLVNEECNGVFAAFLQAFRRDWKQATLLFFALLFASSIVAADLYCLFLKIIPTAVLQIICVLPLIALLFTAAYAFPLQAKFCNPLMTTLKNALLLSLANLPVTLCIVVLNLTPLLLFLLSSALFFRTLLVFFIIGFSGICYLDTLCLRKLFARLARQAEPPAALDEQTSR